MKIGNIINGMTSGGALNESDVAAFKDMRARIPGWSELVHMAFFKCVALELASDLGQTKRMPQALICGVYHGLDAAILNRFKTPWGLPVTGVDLFSAEPCADWPPEKRGMTWEQAFGCAPPDIEAARRNAPGIVLAQENSIKYLRMFAEQFDFIYLDTSHDEATVAAELDAIRKAELREGQIIAGDDWSVPDARFNCGVAKAVTAAFHDPIVIANRIWIARRSDMK